MLKFVWLNKVKKKWNRCNIRFSLWKQTKTTHPGNIKSTKLLVCNGGIFYGRNYNWSDVQSWLAAINIEWVVIISPGLARSSCFSLAVWRWKQPYLSALHLLYATSAKKNKSISVILLTFQIASFAAEENFLKKKNDFFKMITEVIHFLCLKMCIWKSSIISMKNYQK